MFKSIVLCSLLLVSTAFASDSKMTKSDVLVYVSEVSQQIRRATLVNEPAVEFVDVSTSKMSIPDLEDHFDSSYEGRLSAVDQSALYKCSGSTSCAVYEIYVSTVGFVRDTGTSYFALVNLNKSTHDLIKQEIYTANH